MSSHNSLSILVVSCDPYSDLWDPFFDLFYRYWPDCPYAVYLQTNHKEYSRKNVNTIKIGDDIDWSSNLKLALDQLPTSNVLLLLEDFFLCKPIQTHVIEKLSTLLFEMKAATCRLVPKPPPDVHYDDVLNVGTISKGQNYRVSFQAGIWSKKVLNDLLRSGENPWRAEMEGSKRSNELSQPFLSVDKAPYSQWPIHYLNAVIKRKWTPEAVKFCRQNEISLDLELRSVCNWYDQLRRKRFFRRSVSLLIEVVKSLLGDRIYAALKNNPILRRLIY